ncbi:polynucleotide kinase-phosphatase [Viridibacillus sp. YIM B01967]|uniref:Polynucleotide kinase-phosphatase n=1 Tax=Viridibacillus soli TaxID=2798301 RepID=A0ABS1H952_9BACL|nr:polynucleotide kinase-phosphatase [Viridibacillus soli]MBK3495945.1 polynucleotide kinase-phosphatase [Viridibacillus soli]
MIKIPHAGIVIMIGASNSGKSTLLRKWIADGLLLPSEVVSSDHFRQMLGDTDFIDWTIGRSVEEVDSLYETYQKISSEAFHMMEETVEARCRLNKVTFIDATHIHPDDRGKYIQMAKRVGVPITALLLDTALETLLSRDLEREKPRGKNKVKKQYNQLKKEKRFIKKEEYARIYVLKEGEEVTIERMSNPLLIDVAQGIDIIGDIHACYDEMITLIEQLGYTTNEDGLYVHPEGRKLLSLGDIMSRGPESLKTMQFWMQHVNTDLAYMVDSNHGWKIARWLRGKTVKMAYGDEKFVEEMELYEQQNSEEATTLLKQQLENFLIAAPSHYILTQNDIPTAVCVHAGIKDEMIGKESRDIKDFSRYGETAGIASNGRPIRLDWTVHHHNSLLVIWGHDPKPQPLIANRTVNIDQGVVFGGQLTALRYPEKTFIAVNAKQDYAEDPTNPLNEWEKKRLDPPNITKLVNGYTVLTADLGEVEVLADYVQAAIDTTSHFTVPLEQLVYIPPTMSPTPKPSQLDDYLEHPQEAIDYFKSKGVTTLVAEKKHMGSRAVLLLFKNKEVALQKIGFATLGIIYSRTGRRFFERETEQQVVQSLNEELTAKGYFTKNDTDFVLLDAEIMPWNLKAKELIRSQYAHIAEQAILDRSKLLESLTQGMAARGDLAPWLSQMEEKLEHAEIFKEVFQKYCWNVDDVDAIQIAPFHVLAHSKQTFFGEPHTWHMKQNEAFAESSKWFVRTDYRIITDKTSEQEVVDWWTTITEQGHEGIVIKPEYFITKYKGQLIQPALKVRGRKYLNIIYGMDYTEPANLERLKQRNTGKKQRMALQEFTLGIEGIRRFVNNESLERIHESVLATLAMESTPVDPRL